MKAMVNIEATQSAASVAVGRQMATALQKAVERGQNSVAIAIAEALRAYAPQVTGTMISNSQFTGNTEK